MNDHLFSPDDTLPVVDVFTDGACLGNPGPGGWAYIIRDPKTGHDITHTGGEDHTTNNRMELMAVIQALRSLKDTTKVRLHGDSQYVLNGISDWMAGWKKRGWRKADKKPVLNADLWQEIDRLNQLHHIEVTWVKGHDGHTENEWCDQAASGEAFKRQEMLRG